MYEALKVANYFLYKRYGQLTPMQVLKLVYFAHGWTLKLTGKPLIYEPVEAWRWGPVVRSVFDAFKHHGNGYIGEALPKYKKNIVNHKQILDRVFKLYGQKSGRDLSALTHMIGTPWYEIYIKQKKNWGSAIIPDELIRDYFERTLVKEPNSDH